MTNIQSGYLKTKSGVQLMTTVPYPIGAIYLSVDNTNPSKLFGGTWEPIQGRFLLGAGVNDNNTTNYWGTYPAATCNFPAGEKGGEPQNILSIENIPSHNHIQDGHNHTGKIKPTDGHVTGNSNEARKYSDSSVGIYEDTITNWVQPAISYTGGGKSHNNMPPYLVVYMWKRIA